MTPDIKILYENASIVVALKPSGVDSQTSSGKNMVDILSEITGSVIYPVHRLDRDTAGVTVYAKTSSAAASLSSAFSEGTVEKTYLAVTIGVPTETEGTYRDFLYHDAKRNKSFVVDKKRNGVREAVLSYSVVSVIPEMSVSPSENASLALVKIKLQTGRTHQVRVQFASRKTPLYGDARYGGKAADSSKPSLVCVSLSFPDPESKKFLTFTYSPSGGVWDLFSDLKNHIE